MKRQKRQPRVKGGRARLAPSVLHEIDVEVTKVARQFGVSKSWVIATALAEVMGIKDQADYRETRKLRRVK
jgi:hypothetical protein